MAPTNTKLPPKKPRKPKATEVSLALESPNQRIQKGGDNAFIDGACSLALEDSLKRWAVRNDGRHRTRRSKHGLSVGARLAGGCGSGLDGQCVAAAGTTIGHVDMNNDGHGLRTQVDARHFIRIG